MYLYLTVFPFSFLWRLMRLKTSFSMFTGHLEILLYYFAFCPLLLWVVSSSHGFVEILYMFCWLYALFISSPIKWLIFFTFWLFIFLMTFAEKFFFNVVQFINLFLDDECFLWLKKTVPIPREQILPTLEKHYWFIFHI